jgi:hypothetical protein
MSLIPRTISSRAATPTTPSTYRKFHDSAVKNSAADAQNKVAKIETTSIIVSAVARSDGTTISRNAKRSRTPTAPAGDLRGARPVLALGVALPGQQRYARVIRQHGRMRQRRSGPRSGPLLRHIVDAVVVYRLSTHEGIRSAFASPFIAVLTTFSTDVNPRGQSMLFQTSHQSPGRRAVRSPVGDGMNVSQKTLRECSGGLLVINPSGAAIYIEPYALAAGQYRTGGHSIPS